MFLVHHGVTVTGMMGEAKVAVHQAVTVPGYFFVVTFLICQILASLPTHALASDKPRLSSETVDSGSLRACLGLKLDRNSSSSSWGCRTHVGLEYCEFDSSLHVISCSVQHAVPSPAARLMVRAAWPGCAAKLGHLQQCECTTLCARSE